MVVIFSSESDISTSRVLEWLYYFEQKAIRVNGKTLRKASEITTSMNSSSSVVKLNQKTIIELQKVKSVWFRRLFIPRRFKKGQYDISDKSLEKGYRRFIDNEYRFSILSLYSLFRTIPFAISDHLFLTLRTKINEMVLASDLGLKVPDTIITSSKSDLISFLEKNKRCIVKPIEEGLLARGKQMIVLLSKIIDEASVKQLPDEICPSIFQEYIEKDYELRVFFFENKFYSMAIFSQSNKKTMIDFRAYDNQKPNRTVPYQLPDIIETQLAQLMKRLNLKIASIDLIKSTDGKYVFLEANPEGQFGMVDFPCNYFLHKKLATALKNSKTK